MPDAAAARRQPFFAIVAVAAAFAVTVLCYWPSLSGPFLFDDIPNLELLGNTGGLNSVDTYMEFITSGQSGPLGRPLSLATFTIDGQNWPTDAQPFRITNLVIHLINGLLVFLLVRSILAVKYDEGTALKLALLCMALWLLHPLLVSTTAYVIQRMTQLAGLFVMIGLLCYVHGRKQLAETPRRGWTWILAGMGVSGVLAVLSKESGILLPLYALAIEVTVFGRAALGRAHRGFLFTVLLLPVAALLGYFALHWEALQLGFEYRPYSMKERLLTQPVVLVEYLHQVFAPRMSGLGIIQDDFPVSTSLLNPVATLLSLIGLIVLVAAAFWCRGRLPYVSLGVLWFIAGHSLEAGPLSLELYFDHRNYLPLVGPLVAVVSILPLLPDKFRRAAYLGLFLFLCLESFLTWQSARLWSNEDLMMQVASVDHPDSLRVQQHAGNKFISAGQYEQALQVQESIAANFPDHTSTRLSILNLRCQLGTLTPDQVAATQAFLGSGSHDQQINGFFSTLLARAVDNACTAFSLADYHATLDAALRSAVIGGSPKTRGAAHYFKGLAYARNGELDAAIEQLDLSYDAWPDLDVRLQQLVWLLSRGKVDEAERYLELARQHLDKRFWSRGLREADLLSFQQQIEEARRLLQDSPGY